MKTRAGNWRKMDGYRAFIPKPLPPDPPLNLDENMMTRLAEAERQVGRLESASLLIPDPDRFVSMYVRQEAVLSSQIEGTQASLTELLEYEAATGEPERTVDLGEVINYLAALRHGLNGLADLPISSRLLCDVHRVLMTGTRGGESARTPGEFRRTQNWIGGTGPAGARFVPPPPDDMKLAMSDLDKYLNQSKNTPLFIETGLVHAQFETIHPFLDGNGRLGRLLITFLLTARGALTKPMLYLSHYFKKHRDEYYDRLQAIRMEGDWEGWLLFFLTGMAVVAEEATTRARRILELQRSDQELTREKLGQRAGIGLKLLDHLIEKPITTTSIVRKMLGVSQPTADRLLTDLETLGILREATGLRRGRRYTYHKYLALFEE